MFFGFRVFDGVVGSKNVAYFVRGGDSVELLGISLAQNGLTKMQHPETICHVVASRNLHQLHHVLISSE